MLVVPPKALLNRILPAGLLSPLGRLRLRTGAIVAGVLLAAACAGGDKVTGPAASTSGGDPVTHTEPQPVAPSQPAPPSVNPFAGARFYLDTYSSAQQQINAWAGSRPSDADQLQKLTARPRAKWFGDWVSDIFAAVSGVMSAADKQQAVPVLVAYGIPLRDCGGYSAGGQASADAYRSWISRFAAAISGRKAAVVLEPDALAGLDCLSAPLQQQRIDLLRYAVQTLKAQPNVAVYVDAGHARWQSASEMSRRLKLVGVDLTDGFALNVSNFISTAASTSYGSDISALVGGKHFIIDTSRNGLGATPDYQWCNPPGRALGAAPTWMTGSSLVDAYVWIKVPGESDGECNGGPVPGTWWADYALGLAQRG